MISKFISVMNNMADDLIEQFGLTPFMKLDEYLIELNQRNEATSFAVRCDEVTDVDLVATDKIETLDLMDFIQIITFVLKNLDGWCLIMYYTVFANLKNYKQYHIIDQQANPNNSFV